MSQWHVLPDELEAWVDGETSQVGAASIEQHLLVCEHCRASLGSVSAVDLPGVWSSIRDRIEEPGLNLVGRILVGLGASQESAYLVSAAPSLSGAWITGVALVLLFSVAAALASGTEGVTVYLIIAPLAPLVGVAFAFGGQSDPLSELTLAAPYSKLRLLLWRSAAVLASTFPITVLAALPVEGPWWVAAVWLIPASAFIAVTLSASAWADPQWVAAGIIVCWIVIQGLVVAAGRPFASVTGPALVLYAVVVGAAGYVFIVRGRTMTPHWKLP